MEKSEVDYMLEAVERKHYKSAKGRLKFVRRKTSIDLMELKFQVFFAKVISIFTRYINLLVRYYEVSEEVAAFLEGIISELEKDRENILYLMSRIKYFKNDINYSFIIADICDNILGKRSALVKHYSTIKDIAQKAVMGIDYIPAEPINSNAIYYNDKIDEFMLYEKNYMSLSK